MNTGQVNDKMQGGGYRIHQRTPLHDRRWPFPRLSGFLMPFLWFLYDWL